MLTPMRKLIMKMEDMALIICNQCVSDNGKKPENDDYTVNIAHLFAVMKLQNVVLRSSF